MSEQPHDPAGNTQQFRRFAEAPEVPDPAAGVKRIAIIGAFVVLAAAVVLVLVVALR